MKKYALIGRHLGHSYSQQWFNDLFARLGLNDHSYTLCEMPSVDGLRAWVQREGICGMNVTVPFKRDVVAQLDATDPTAAAIGAVNCITVEHTRDSADGLRLTGHNTDAPAFAETLMSRLSAFGLSLPHSALVLGTGGAAHAVACALQTLGIRATFVSRNAERLKVGNSIMDVVGYNDLHRLPAHDFPVLVNATPVGMYPDIDSSPLPSDFAFSDFNIQLVYDLVYNPSPTLLMRQAASQGLKAVDGLAMLHRQAELSWQLFNRQ